MLNKQAVALGKGNKMSMEIYLWPSRGLFIAPR